MTDVVKRPGSVCEMSERAQALTGWQVALNTLGLNTLSAEAQVAMSKSAEFSHGWENGIEGDLVNEMPTEETDEADRDRLAWIVGLVAGQVAQQREYDTPFCVMDHGSECEAINAAETSAV